MSRDISYCSYCGCENRECERHQGHLNKGERRSIAPFPECSYYKKMLKEVAEQDEREFDEETRREAHDLD